MLLMMMISATSLYMSTSIQSTLDVLQAMTLFYVGIVFFVVFMEAVVVPTSFTRLTHNVLCTKPNKVPKKHLWKV